MARQLAETRIVEPGSDVVPVGRVTEQLASYEEDADRLKFIEASVESGEESDAEDLMQVGSFF